MSFTASSRAGSLACANEEKAIWEVKGPSHLKSGDPPLSPLGASCCRSTAEEQAHLPPWSQSNSPTWDSSVFPLMSSPSSCSCQCSSRALSQFYSHVHFQSSDGPSADRPPPPPPRWQARRQVLQRLSTMMSHGRAPQGRDDTLPPKMQ